jgi:hypothetical protein
LLARSSLLLTLVACASAPPPDPVVRVAASDHDPAPKVAAARARLSDAERRAFTALARECGDERDDESTTHRLGESEEPTVPDGEITGPIQVEIAPDVGFARLGAFMKAFLPHGAGVRMVVGRDTFFLSGEGELDSIPLAPKERPRCDGGWSVHVDGRWARVHAGAVSWPRLDVGELRERAEELDHVAEPFVLALNATAETPVEVAVFAAVTIACAVGGDASPILLLGDDACPSAQGAGR